jgi:hypothetical protein
VTEKSAYHQFSQVQPPSSHLIPHSQIQFRLTRRCLQPPLKPQGFPVINLELGTAASLGFQKREEHQRAATQHLTIRSYDMMCIFSRTGMSHFWCVASLPLHTRCADQGTDRWYAVLRPSILLFSRFHLLLYTICQLGIRDHEALPIVISIGDVKRNDFEALLSVLYPA